MSGHGIRQNDPTERVRLRRSAARRPVVAVVVLLAMAVVGGASALLGIKINLTGNGIAPNGDASRTGHPVRWWALTPRHGDVPADRPPGWRRPGITPSRLRHSCSSTTRSSFVHNDLDLERDSCQDSREGRRAWN
jgi:hypothetical protein